VPSNTPSRQPKRPSIVGGKTSVSRQSRKPTSSSTQLRRSDPASSSSGSGGAKTVAISRATRSGPGGVGTRRMQGMGLALKMSLVIAILMAVVVTAWGAAMSYMLRNSLEETIKRNGAQAALVLAASGNDYVQKFLTAGGGKPPEGWQKLDLGSVRKFSPKEGADIENDIHEAMILFPSAGTQILIASTDPNKAPSSISCTEVFLVDNKMFKNVQCLKGSIETADGIVDVMQFKAPFKAEGWAAECSAWVVIRTAQIDHYINNLMFMGVLLGVFFVIAGVGVSALLAGGIVRPVRRLMRDMDIVSRGDFNHVTKRTSNDEVGLLAMTFNDMTKNLKIGQELEIESEKVQAELDTAREIQAHLLPAKIPQLPGFDIYQAYSPAKEVGGDYFDFIPVDRENLGVIVADVSGKGIPGSMVMGSTRTVLRMLATGNGSASDTLCKTNAIVARDIKRGMFVTAIYGVLNVRQKTLTVASAGHNPMVLYRARTGKCELVNPAGIALGFDKGPIFNRTVKEQTIQLYKGDRFVMYTDGVVEAMDEQQEEYGDDRFYKWVHAHAQIKSRDFIRALLQELLDYRGKAEQHDDITVVTVKVN
jgi:serine phosphatase RsbU (regulator of sigma subunit)